MPKLKSLVESILSRYLSGELTDNRFKADVQAILDEFKGKNLLHQNIGQLTRIMEIKKPSKRDKFKKIWILFDQVSPRIREDLKQRMIKGPNRKSGK
ncbi:MAG: hypothetical protein JSV51_09310 [Candidatus Bathyarchaeota archaeon]|nr:MAG: hypothetical protein JSV51_09310 [Candidatus Bathyarchaeota archaeon]